ncbi:MAG: ribosome-associated translation inhibitor RaiA [Clostridiales bacterium]|nr:ribosome-associated translation inhibitor RaiA [Clostridiales bacterium]
MNYKFTGKDSVLSDSLKERVKSKLDRLDKFLPANTNANVKLSIVKHEHKIEVTIPMRKRVLRAEVVDVDMYSAVDKIIDILEKQLIKYKSRLREKSRKEPAFKEEFNSLNIDENVLTNDNLLIERTKKFAVKPMDPEEAIMEMELLGHNFYVFKNPESDEVNVVYKRNEGSYGLIEPNF